MKIINHTVGLIGGILVGFGFTYAGVVVPEVIFRLLTLNDFGVIILALCVSLAVFLSFRILPGFIKTPFFNGEFTAEYIYPESNVVLGALIFGIGWGISGIGPGTAVSALGAGLFPVVFAVVGMFMGTVLSAGFSKR